VNNPMISGVSNALTFENAITLTLYFNARSLFKLKCFVECREGNPDRRGTGKWTCTRCVNFFGFRFWY